MKRSIPGLRNPIHVTLLTVVAAAVVVAGSIGLGAVVGPDPGGATAPSTGTSDSDPPAPSGTSCYTGQEAFEPSMGATSNGTLFMQSDAGPSSVQGETDERIVRSWGRCTPWQDVSLTVDVAGRDQSVPPNSNDPYVHVDPAADRVFNLDMQGLSCNWISFSDDFGATWIPNPLGCGQPPVLDHPTLFTGPPRLDGDQAALDAVGYPSVAYLCVNRLVDTACARSLDGGASFGAFVPRVFGGCGGATGHGTAGPDGRIYLGTSGCGDRPTVAFSQTDALSWQSRVIDRGSEVFGHDVEVAVDEAGNVYALWIDEDTRDLRLAASTDHGRTWTDPVTGIEPSDVETTSFRTIAAGADGRIALAYYGSASDTLGDNGVPDDATWSAYVTVSTDATAATPTFESTATNPAGDPVARGECSIENRCSPPEQDGVGDFIDVIVDDDGRPWATLVDVCNGACIDGDRKSGVQAFAGTLTAGPALRGPAGPLPGLP